VATFCAALWLTFTLPLTRAVRPLKDEDKPIKWWRVYAEAMGMDQKSISQLESNHIEDEETRDRMTRSAKKFYKQAERLIKNAAIGQFPKDE
jgi:hypothetical protein